MKTFYFIFFLLFISLISCSKTSENLKVESSKTEHFILGEWRSESGKEKNVNFFMIFQPDNSVRVLLKKGDKVTEENIYAYKILDENNVQVDYIKPLEVKKIGDNFHFESSCNQPLIDPPILCFKDRFEKIK